jgi:hypothetical protein
MISDVICGSSRRVHNHVCVSHESVTGSPDLFSTGPAAVLEAVSMLWVVALKLSRDLDGVPRLLH